MASRKIQTYQNKAKNLCTIYFAFDLDREKKQNIIVTKQMCSWLPLSCKQNLVLFILPRWQLDYVVHPGRAWCSSPCTWHCSLHYLISPGNSLNKARDDRGLGWQWNHASFFALIVSISSLFVPALLRTHSISVFFCP